MSISSLKRLTWRFLLLGIFLSLVLAFAADRVYAYSYTQVWQDHFTDPNLTGWKKILNGGYIQQTGSVVNVYNVAPITNGPDIYRQDLNGIAPTNYRVDWLVNFYDALTFGQGVVVVCQPAFGGDCGTAKVLAFMGMVYDGGKQFDVTVVDNNLAGGQWYYLIASGSAVLPYENRWHRLRLEKYGTTTYLYVDLYADGSWDIAHTSTNTAYRPTTTYIGDPTTQVYAGMWTRVSADWVTIYQVNANDPPSCSSLTVPQFIRRGEAVDISITGTDPDGNLASIEAYYSPTSSQSWTLIGSQGCSGSRCTRTFSWNTTSVPDGDYYVVGNVYDTDGAKCSGNPWGVPSGWSSCPNCRKTVTITTPTPTCTLTANPSSGTAPLSGTLTWTTTNSPTSCTASGSWSGSKSRTGGSEGYGPLNAGTYTYNLSCANAGGTGTCSATVTAAPPSCPADPSSYPNDNWDRVWCRWNPGSRTFTDKLADVPDEASTQFDTDWGGGNVGGIQPDQIGFRSGRTINLSTAGTYKFTLGSDDGAKLWIDGTLRIDRWADQGYSTSSINLNLAAGDHTFRIDYYENGGGARVSFSYVPLGSITGKIWNDINNVGGTCGMDVSGKPAYTGGEATVTYTCSTPPCTTVSDSNGNYRFDNVPISGYQVSISFPSGSSWFITSQNPCPANLAAAGAVAIANFGVSNNPLSWIQGVNGDIYGNGITVTVPTQEVWNTLPPPGYNRWFLDADPAATSGGVVISGNATLTCGGGTSVDGRCSRRSNPNETEPGWRVKGEQMGWPPLTPANLSAEPSFPGWNNLAPKKVYRFTSNLTISSGTTYDLTGDGVAIIHVRNANLTFNANFVSSSEYREGVIFIVENGQVSIGGAVTRINALILATGTGGNITVGGLNVASNLVVRGMLYAQNGINFARTLTNNRIPAVQVRYNPLYFHRTNPLAVPQITWREIAP